MSARENGLNIDEEIEDFAEVQVNMWTSNGKIIRLVENPFTPFRIPYQSFSYETESLSILWYRCSRKYG